MTRKMALGTAMGLVALLAWVSWVSAGEAVARDGDLTILDTTSFWRCHFTWMLPVVKAEQGLLAIDPIGRMKEPIELNQAQLGLGIQTPLPATNWMQSQFDDSSWCRVPGPFFYDRSGLGRVGGGSGGGGEGSSEYLKLLSLRGKFRVSDPARVEELTFSITYRGGVAVYLNGKEIARGHLPPGEITPETPAQDYPQEAYSNPKDSAGGRGASKETESVSPRIRELLNVPIPTSFLREGTNVLAVAVQRPLLPPAILDSRGKRPGWATVGVTKLKLSATKGGALVANLVRPQGLQVWNADVSAGVYDQDYGEPHEALQPIRFVGARNGSYSGKVVLSSTQPLRRLQAEVDDLTHVQGKERICAAQVQVRYALLGSAVERNAQYRYPAVANVLRFDGLTEEPLVEVPVMTRAPNRHAPTDSRLPVFGAVQPVWVTVHIPKEAPPGDYRGKLTLSLQGAKPVEVPIELSVVGWTLPDPHDFRTFVDLIQSPESVALYYNVPLWSDRHFKLMEKSFEQMARIGAKVVYIPMIGRTHFGNAQSMVRWIKQPDGTYTYDFSIFDRYLDLATRTLGKPTIVCLYVWERYTGGGWHWGKNKVTKDLEYWGTSLVSALDPATGKVEQMAGRGFEDTEAEAFWRPVLHQVRQRLIERGVLDAMMLGLASLEVKPSRELVTMLHRILPEARWVVHTHSSAKNLYGVPVGYLAHVWGAAWGRESIPDPTSNRKYGWRGSFFDTTFPRWPGGSITVPGPTAPLSVHRELAESMLLAGRCGFGRVTADFWPVLKDERGRLGRLANRYLLSNWAQLSVRGGWLTPGPEGALSNARLEMLIEGVQECEARIFIEKALLESRDKLGEALAQRCQQVLDERTQYTRWVYVTNAATWLWYPHSGWQERSLKLYQAAADVTNALSSS